MEYGNSRVLKYAAGGKPINAWENPGTGPGEFDLLRAIEVDSRGRVLAGDRQNDRIQIFDREGALLEIRPGLAPYGPAFNHDGVFFVADARASRIREFDANDAESLGRQPCSRRDRKRIEPPQVNQAARCRTCDS